MPVTVTLCLALCKDAHETKAAADRAAMADAAVLVSRFMRPPRSESDRQAAQSFLRDLLDIPGTYLSGSLMVYLVFGSQDRWQPHDIDIFTGERTEYAVRRLLEASGYSVERDSRVRGDGGFGEDYMADYLHEADDDDDDDDDETANARLLRKCVRSVVRMSRPALAAYQAFFEATLPKMKGKLLSKKKAGDRWNVTDQNAAVKMVGARWRKMSDAQKQKFAEPQKLNVDVVVAEPGVDALTPIARFDISICRIALSKGGLVFMAGNGIGRGTGPVRPPLPCAASAPPCHCQATRRAGWQREQDDPHAPLRGMQSGACAFAVPYAAPMPRGAVSASAAGTLPLFRLTKLGAEAASQGEKSRLKELERLKKYSHARGRLAYPDTGIPGREQQVTRVSGAYPAKIEAYESALAASAAEREKLASAEVNWLLCDESEDLSEEYVASWRLWRELCIARKTYLTEMFTKMGHLRDAMMEARALSPWNREVLEKARV